MFYIFLACLWTTTICSSIVGTKESGTLCKADDECVGVSMCLYAIEQAKTICTCLRPFSGDLCSTTDASSIYRNHKCYRDDDCKGRSFCRRGTGALELHKGVRKVHGHCTCERGYGGNDCSSKVESSTLCWDSEEFCAEEMICMNDDDQHRCNCIGRLSGPSCNSQIHQTAKRGEICTSDNHCIGSKSGRSYCGYPPVASITTPYKICMCKSGHFGPKCELTKQLKNRSKCQLHSDCAGASQCIDGSKGMTCECSLDFEGDTCTERVGELLKSGEICIHDLDCNGNMKCSPTDEWEDYESGDGPQYTCQCPLNLDE